jgi:hypothetical protein
MNKQCTIVDVKTSHHFNEKGGFVEELGEGDCIGSHGFGAAEHLYWFHEKGRCGGVSVWQAFVKPGVLSLLKQ